MRVRRVGCVIAAILVAALAGSAVPGTAAEQEGSGTEAGQSKKQRSAKLSVGLRVKGFRANGRRSTARAIAVASLRDSKGRTRRVKQPVTLRVAQSGGCQILHLVLDKLDLNLLGLNIHLDKVRLRITGRSGGGVLGKLFCRLARADVSLGKRQKAARAMTARVRKSRGRLVGFSARVHPQATATQEQQTCDVLQLTLGPLDLDLLGLIVELNEVKLDITATRGAGVLGDLFCELADNNNASPEGTQEEPAPAEGEPARSG